MLTRLFATALLFSGIAALTACKPAAAPPSAPVAAPTATPAQVAAEPTAPAPVPSPDQSAPKATGPDAWLGKWTGPEGTSLTIEAKDEGYQLTIHDLDRLRFFGAQRKGDAITFERDGKSETIHATDGKATGMKWLADKKNCLTVHASEGYCRD